MSVLELAAQCGPMACSLICEIFEHDISGMDLDSGILAAALSGNIQAVQCIWQKSPQGFRGILPDMKAEDCDAEELEVIIQELIDDVGHPSRALQCAVAAGATSTVEISLRNGANPNQLTQQGHASRARPGNGQRWLCPVLAQTRC